MSLILQRVVTQFSLFMTLPPPPAVAPLSMSTPERSTSSSPASVEEDEQVLKWQESGALKDIIGSQSMLSQELSQDTTPVFFETELSATAAAQQYGLLTQEDPHNTMLENDNEKDDDGREKAKNHHDNAVLERLVDDDTPVVATIAKNHHDDIVLDQLVDHTIATNQCEPSVRTTTESYQYEVNTDPCLSQDSLRLSNMANLNSLLDAVDMLQDTQMEEFSESRLSQTEAYRVSSSIEGRLDSRSNSSQRQSNRISAKRKRFPRVVVYDDTVRMKQEVMPNDQNMKKPTKTKKRARTANGDTSAIPNSQLTDQPSMPVTFRSTKKTATLQSRASSSLVKSSRPNPDQAIARRAAELAERACHDAKLAKKLLMSMTLSRENPRGERAHIPPRGHIIPDGFHWATYPPLEKLLKERMAEYYQRSTSQRQSTQQQTFNNQLVVLVREEVERQGWSFEAVYQEEKAIRDRIRCFYKTHIQNSKKRLCTMLRNPTKRSNAVHLMQHYALISKTLHSTTNLEEDINVVDGFPDQDDEEEDDEDEDSSDDDDVDDNDQTDG